MFELSSCTFKKHYLGFRYHVTWPFNATHNGALCRVLATTRISRIDFMLDVRRLMFYFIHSVLLLASRISRSIRYVVEWIDAKLLVFCLNYAFHKWQNLDTNISKRCKKIVQLAYLVTVIELIRQRIGDLSQPNQITTGDRRKMLQQYSQMLPNFIHSFRWNNCKNIGQSYFEKDRSINFS